VTVPLQRYDATLHARVTSWLAQGDAAGASRAPGTTPAGNFVGTARRPKLPYLAQIYIESRAYLNNPDADNVPAHWCRDALAWHAAVALRLFGALRGGDLELVRRKHVGDPATLAARGITTTSTALVRDMIVHMKPAGRGPRRQTRIVLSDECAIPLTAYLAAASRAPEEPLFDASIHRRLRREIGHGSRHALASAAIELYEALGWAPAQWVAFEQMQGRAVRGFPFGAEDDLTYAMARDVMDQLALAYRDMLISAYWEGHHGQG